MTTWHEPGQPTTAGPSTPPVRVASPGPSGEPEWHNDIVDYYRQTIPDYQFWSPEGYCHFGYWRWDIAPWNRSEQLREMSRQVIGQMGIAPDRTCAIGDFGCGTGAVARFARTLLPHSHWRGVTLSPEQAAVARRFIDPNVEIQVGDFHALPYRDESLDAGCFVESLCHSPNRQAALAEAWRVLKPAARLVIADGFARLEHPPRWLQPIVKRINRNWALPNIALLKQTLGDAERCGFALICRRDISWRVAPSALQGPFLAAWYALRLRWKGNAISPRRLQHLAACALGVVLGLPRYYFGYWLITLEKRRSPRNRSSPAPLGR